MATRKQHPRITVTTTSEPEQGEISGEDEYTKEKDAQMKRQREEVQLSKTKDSTRTVLTRYPKDPVELDSIREARQNRLHSQRGEKASPSMKTETSRSKRRSPAVQSSEMKVESPNSKRAKPPPKTDIPNADKREERRSSSHQIAQIKSEGGKNTTEKRHSPKRGHRDQYDSKRRLDTSHSRSRDLERMIDIKKTELTAIVTKSFVEKFPKLSTPTKKDSASADSMKISDSKSELEEPSKKNLQEDSSSSPKTSLSKTTSLSRKSSQADIKPIHTPAPLLEEELQTASVKRKKVVGNSPVSDTESELSVAPSDGTKSSASEDEGRSPLYGPARSKFERDSPSKYGLAELSPATPEDVIVEEEDEVPDESGLPSYFPGIDGCRSVDEFECINRIEEGTYGVVYRARDKRTNEVVALKRLKMEKEKEGFPITSLREVSTLLKAHHPNVVAIKEVVVGHNMDKIYMVMEFVEHDLKALMETMRQPFSIGEVKTLMRQLLSAVKHLHENWIIHRDLKTSNLLLNHRGILKVGDFGLAREYGSPLRPYTPVVVTLWYRSPELLLGTKEYSTPVDVWSVGCIFAEFLTLKPLFPGKSEIEQINKIFKELGNPSEANWPGFSELPLVKGTTFVEYPYNILRKRFPQTVLTNSGYDLLSKLLEYNPKTRITADEALKHIHFRDVPLPVDPSMFPTWPARSEQGPRGPRNNTPKPPSGGKQYKETADDDGLDGFRIGGQKDASSLKGEGFRLKF